MKKFALVLTYAVILIAVVGWNTREKYLDGIGVAHSIKTRGFDMPVVLGLAVGVAILIYGLFIRGRKK